MARVRIESGAVASPNIWQHPATYELENRAFDPDGLVEQAMRAVRDWAGAAVLDVGCGTGFHLPRFAERAARVVGVEPHAGLARVARTRCAGRPDVEVLAGTAQRLPLPAVSVDVVHARWAYFFGPGCEPGLAELDRVLRAGGAAFVVDHDATAGSYAPWFHRSVPDLDPAAVERFWSLRGWTRTPVATEWRFGSRADLEAVVRIELPPDLADGLLAAHPGTALGCAVNVWWRRAGHR